MKTIIKLIERFLSSATFCVLLLCCSNMKLTDHLKEVNKTNTQVDLDGWQILNKYITEDECYYNLLKIKDDTTLSFSFTYFKKLDVYKVDDLIKSSFKKGVYNEIALINNDTLYHFISYNDSSRLEPSKPIDYKSLNFITGKYYFLYRRGFLNWKQKAYFENNSDSLLKIRGNDLPELPNDTTYAK